LGYVGVHGHVAPRQKWNGNSLATHCRRRFNERPSIHVEARIWLDDDLEPIGATSSSELRRRNRMIVVRYSRTWR
jgi:hypothetical protein